MRKRYKKKLIKIIVAGVVALGGYLGVEFHQQTYSAISIEDVPEYSGQPYVIINDNEPYFDKDDLTTQSFEKYSSLDSLGRCGVAYANIGEETMPTEKRGNIGMIKPSGWQTKRYDGIVSEKLGYVYNRSHLAMFKLFDNLFDTNVKENLITGTRFFNADDEYGMLHYENMALDYVYDTGNTLLYRVTPIFEGDNLVAKGVIMEAESLEDNGGGLEFCVFIYNVQPNVVSPDKPGIEIDYATGLTSIASKANTSDKGQTGNTEVTYILNTNSKKIHRPDCDSVSQMSQRNKKETNQSKEELIKDGYTPCQSCNP